MKMKIKRKESVKMKEIEFKVNEFKVKERGVKTYVYTDEKKVVCWKY